MYHTLSDHACVSISPSGMYIVNGKKQVSQERALETVFAGHYRRFLIELYRDLQVPCSDDEVMA